MVDSIKLSNELTSLFKWSQFCFWLDMLMTVEMDAFTYEKVSFLTGVKFAR